MTKTASIAALAALLTTAVALPAGAQTNKAKELFNVGAAAYGAGNYADAIRAFESAYQADPRPGILFSLAQAHRRLYTSEHATPHLLASVKYYRDYLAKGGDAAPHRAEANEALAVLDPLAQAASSQPAAAAPPAPAPPPSQPHVMGYSNAEGTMMIVDGGAPAPVGKGVDVKPGKHTVKFVAPGYVDFEVAVDAAEGQGVIPISAPMTEKPGRFQIDGPAGADVAVDGRPQGKLPLGRPLELPPGRHFLAITKNGYRAFTEELDVAQGDERKLATPLERTGQRFASMLLMGAGVAGLAVGGVFAGLTLDQQRKAQSFLDAQKAGNVTPQQLADYNTARGARDDDRRWMGVAFAAGASVGLLGLGLFAFDTPVVSLPPQRLEDKRPIVPKKPDQQMEMGALPIVGPGFYGGSVRGTF